MSDSDDFQLNPRHGGGAGGGGRVQAAPQLPAQQIPQWRINPPPKKRVLDHLENVVRDVQLMVEETSGATRASGARIRPFYEP